VAALLLILAAPVFLACALAVRLGSKGPIFFGQTRVGLRGNFTALKFRTMRVGAERQHASLMDRHGTTFKLKRDPRITGAGRLLRRLSLDELPQLLQVLTGDMSLVGPRPPMPVEVERYRPGQLRRLGVRPGLTGLWQVSGRADLEFEQCVALDAKYIENWSPRLELAILARTPAAVLGGRGAY
jgi:lipopolysaccharide/colanic/teichoic acid biosynthesis glycosyltransferase